MVTRILATVASESAQYQREEWVVPAAGRHIVIKPDRVLLDSSGTIRVQRIRTGRETASELQKPIYGLLHHGLVARYPGRPVCVEVLYLASGKAVPVGAEGAGKGIGEYAGAIRAIEEGIFQPTFDVRRCATCACYFICGG
jgi:hypothetical protein